MNKFKLRSKQSKVKCCYCFSDDGELGNCTHCDATIHFACYAENKGKCGSCNTGDDYTTTTKQRPQPWEAYSWEPISNAVMPNASRDVAFGVLVGLFFSLAILFLILGVLS